MVVPAEVGDAAQHLDGVVERGGPEKDPRQAHHVEGDQPADPQPSAGRQLRRPNPARPVGGTGRDIGPDVGRRDSGRAAGRRRARRSPHRRTPRRQCPSAKQRRLKDGPRQRSQPAAKAHRLPGGPRQRSQPAAKAHRLPGRPATAEPAGGEGTPTAAAARDSGASRRRSGRGSSRTRRRSVGRRRSDARGGGASRRRSGRGSSVGGWALWASAGAGFGTEGAARASGVPRFDRCAGARDGRAPTGERRAETGGCGPLRGLG